MLMNDFSTLSYIDQTDHEILMHRDVHFSGSFVFMLDYYQKQGKGIQAEFDIDRIKFLKNLEDQSHKNLSLLVLDDEEKSQIHKAKDKYLALRDIYESGTAALPKLFADLILSEDLEATQEIKALCQYGHEATPLLIQLIQDDEFYDPLFPGYGLAPEHAATCLGKLKESKAIIALFEALGKSDTFMEDALLEALRNIGSDAQVFLMNILQKKPFTKDNENAAIALLHFLPSTPISQVFLKTLKDMNLKKNPNFLFYLLIGCDDLISQDDRDTFIQIAKNLPSKELMQEASKIIKKWET